MKCFLFVIPLICYGFTALGVIQDSVVPQMDQVYSLDFGKKVNQKQKESIELAVRNRDKKLRVMTYNMLYNEKAAEDKLPEIHRWDCRKSKLFAYLTYADVDLIGSQELQEDQVEDVMSVLSDVYGYCGEKTRENEGRTDINAIFYKKSRLELIETKMVPYSDAHFQNAFTFCCFRDKLLDKKIIVLNTKLTWGDVERRCTEAGELNKFSTLYSSDQPIILLGDFNTFPFLQHMRNIFLDGDFIEMVLAGSNLNDAKKVSVLGHFGPMCSITNSKSTLQPFIGPELTGFILDHIYVNHLVKVFTHGIDTAKVDGEFPSDHFPVISDLFFFE